MTSTPINEMLSFMSLGTGSGKNVTGNGTPDDTFQNILQGVSVTEELDTSKSSDMLARDNVKLDRAIKNSDSDNTAGRYEQRETVSQDDRVTDKAAPVADSGKTETVKKVVGAKEEEILSKVAEELGITVEELTELMENLGITCMDLASQGNVAQLVCNVMAEGDMTAAVTNEDVSETVLNINSLVTATIEEAASELGISSDELLAKFEEAMTANAKEPVPESEFKAEVPVSSVTYESDSIEMSDGNNESFATVTTVAEETNENAYENEGGDAAEKKGSEHENNETPVINNNQNTASFRDNMPVGQPQVQTVSYTDTAARVDIVNQLTEQMRLNVSENVKELQMQLNPENLGTVNLTLSSKEGMVTASLVTQNESVRAAIESQLQVLKDNLEMQGVKVEAVEVSVGAHEFERNLDEQNRENEAATQEAERLKKATRKLNINGLFDDNNIEALDESEQVTAKMMQADGNTMDYKV